MTSSLIPLGQSSRCFHIDNTEGRRTVCTSELLHLAKPPLLCCQSTVTGVEWKNGKPFLAWHFSATITISIVCKTRIILLESPLTQTAFRNNKTNESKQIRNRYWHLAAYSFNHLIWNTYFKCIHITTMIHCLSWLLIFLGSQASQDLASTITSSIFS